MAFDDSLRKDILKHCDIVKIISSFLNVTKKGKNYVAVCPFHDDTHPSMSISPEKQMFKCFVCGTGGDAISFVEKYTHVSYREAMQKVAELSGYTDPRLTSNVRVKKVDERKEALLKCLHDLTVYYQFALNTVEGKDGLDYLEERKLDQSLRQKYLLGYAPKDGKNTIKFLQGKGHSLKTIEDIGISMLQGGEYSDRNQGRVIFPICDADGNVVGFSARRIKNTDEAKYVNSPETYVFTKSRILYNYHIAKDKARIANCIYVLEGFMDVFALAKIGMDNAVAIMGTALTNEHIEMLRRLNVEVRLCLDGDLPGQTAMLKASKALKDAGINFTLVNNRNSDKDPDEILNEDGAESLKSYLNNTLSRPDFALQYYKNSSPLKTPEQKKALIASFLPILANLNDILEVDSYIRQLASVTGYIEDSIRELLRNYKIEKQKNPEVDSRAMLKNIHPENVALRKLETAEKAMLYQMINDKKAVEFYENNIHGFYNSDYRRIAEFLDDYISKNQDYEKIDIVSSLSESDIEGKEDLQKVLTDLMFDTNIASGDETFWQELNTTINKEKEKINEEDALEASLEGKSELEKARIVAEYNRRRKKKMK